LIEVGDACLKAPAQGACASERALSATICGFLNKSDLVE